MNSAINLIHAISIFGFLVAGIYLEQLALSPNVALEDKLSLHNSASLAIGAAAGGLVPAGSVAIAASLSKKSEPDATKS